jgi:Protein of unknown function (DUF3617)
MTMSCRTLAAIALSAMSVLPTVQVHAGPPPLRSGLYEMVVRLELPHLERWAIDRTARICLSVHDGSGEIPVPVLSANNPFETCAATNLTVDGATFEYDIICPGRGAARAHASYALAPDRFAGRVAMVLGAKNMTMTEVQQARRIGDCEPARESAAVIR